MYIRGGLEGVVGDDGRDWLDGGIADMSCAMCPETGCLLHTLSIIPNENKTELGIQGQIFTEVFEFFECQRFRVSLDKERTSCRTIARKITRQPDSQIAR